MLATNFRGQRASVHEKPRSGTPCTRKQTGHRKSPRLASMLACD